jgi:hypothetical protein
VTYFCTAERFAREAIVNQREAFRSWGVMADWDKCYYTFDKHYVKNLLQQFYRLYEMVCGGLFLIMFSFSPDFLYPQGGPFINFLLFLFTGLSFSRCKTCVLVTIFKVINNSKETKMYKCNWYCGEWYLYGIIPFYVMSSLKFYS